MMPISDVRQNSMHFKEPNKGEGNDSLVGYIIITPGIQICLVKICSHIVPYAMGGEQRSTILLHGILSNKSIETQQIHWNLECASNMRCYIQDSLFSSFISWALQAFPATVLPHRLSAAVMILFKSCVVMILFKSFQEKRIEESQLLGSASTKPKNSGKNMKNSKLTNLFKISAGLVLYNLYNVLTMSTRTKTTFWEPNRAVKAAQLFGKIDFIASLWSTESTSKQGNEVQKKLPFGIYKKFSRPCWFLQGFSTESEFQAWMQKVADLRQNRPTEIHRSQCAFSANFMWKKPIQMST